VENYVMESGGLFRSYVSSERDLIRAMEVATREMREGDVSRVRVINKTTGNVAFSVEREGRWWREASFVWKVGP